MKSRSRFNKVAFWNICAAFVVLGLAVPSVVQESFHQSYHYNAPSGIPTDFPHYYLAGRVARLKPPENLLYYPPAGHTARSYQELRIDATTPYGKPWPGTGLPDGAIKLPFDAPPGAAIIMEPLAFLPWQAAYFAFQLLCVFMMMATVYFALRLAQDGPPSGLALTVGVSVAFLFPPFKRALALGNIDVVLLFVWTLGVFLLSRGRVVASASCFALGTAIKLSPIFAVPLLVMRRQWRWLGAYGAASAVLLAFSVWQVGWQNQVVWLRQVAPALSSGINFFENRSLGGFIYALCAPHLPLAVLPGSPGLCLFSKVVSVTCYSAFLAWCWRRRKDSQGLLWEMVLLPLVVLLVSPISWTQYYVLAVLPLAFLWSRTREQAVAAPKLNLILLAGSTLAFGSDQVEYHLVLALGRYGELLLMAAWLAAALALIAVGMRMYKSCVTRRRFAVADAATQRERAEDQAELVAA